MKPGVNKKNKITKGMPSAVVLSILIHAVLFLFAGLLMVFTVVKKEEKKFEPPKAVERPKMKLRKPKVNVKKTSTPKPPPRIVTKIKRASMPDIQLPEMSGMGEGLGGGIGGFERMPDLGEVTLFGAGQSIGNDFEGTFYDSKRDRQGRNLPVDALGDPWRALLYKFLVRDWDPSVFSHYYRSPKKLYATNIAIPLQPSSTVVRSFGVGDDVVGTLWMVHYKGQLVHKEGITFRFWGMADEFMAVRVQGEYVLAFDFDSIAFHAKKIIGNLWKSDSSDSRKYWLGDERSVVGDWITLEPGVPLDMEILIGDNGRIFCYFLAVEVEGVEYERNRQGGPILPAFKTAEFSRDQLDLIYNYLPEGEICLTNGPVFCDYDIPSRTVATQEPKGVEPPEPSAPVASLVGHGIRTWIFTDGRTLELELINTFGGKAVLKNGAGKIRKVPLEQLSDEDRMYVELAQPPDFNVNFLNKAVTKSFHGGFYDLQWADRPPEKRVHYGFQLKQTRSGEYNHDLQIEMFVVGSQRGGDRYILLDHQQTTFNPARENQRFYEFRSKREVVLDHYTPDMLWGLEKERGEKFAGYLITLTDARGKIIKVDSSKKWLGENLKNLRKLSVGDYMDKTCTRTFPSRPKSRLY